MQHAALRGLITIANKTPQNISHAMHVSCRPDRHNKLISLTLEVMQNMVGNMKDVSGHSDKLIFTRDKHSMKSC